MKKSQRDLVSLVGGMSVGAIFLLWFLPAYGTGTMLDWVIPMGVMFFIIVNIQLAHNYKK